MAMINVSMALISPMLVSSFAVNRRVQTVGINGRVSIIAQAFAGVFGVIYPSDNNELQRLADLQVTGKTITVITRFALRSEAETSGTEYQPDIVVWRGDNFLVKHVEDWSSFGPGFVLAICTSIDLVDMPPATSAPGYGSSSFGAGGFGQ
jgi:uncharacterized membrane protein